MIDYIINRFRESDGTLPVSISIRGGGGGSGDMVAVDGHGIIYVEGDKAANAVPWSSILWLKLVDRRQGPNGDSYQ
jgi:hypothetical protein